VPLVTTHTAKSKVRNGVEFVAPGPDHTESIKISNKQPSVCNLFFDTDGDSHYTKSNGDDSDDSECKGRWRKQTYYDGLCLEGLRKTTSILADD
jgi:hypothetical protein